MVDLKTFSEFLIEKGVCEKYWSRVSRTRFEEFSSDKGFLSEAFCWDSSKEGYEFWARIDNEWRYRIKAVTNYLNNERLPTIADVMLRLDLIEKKLDKLMYVMVSSKGEQ